MPVLTLTMIYEVSRETVAVQFFGEDGFLGTLLMDSTTAVGMIGRLLAPEIEKVKDEFLMFLDACESGAGSGEIKRAA